MRSSFLFIIAISTFCFSQVTIPTPPGHSSANLLPDMINIGDFDNDRCDDIFVVFGEDGSSSGSIFGIYSYRKCQYLLVQETWGPVQAKGDFDGDEAVEIIVNGIIYDFNQTTMSKKKVF
jgi:hypothetical protein